jgi:hypothetical protein
MFCIVNKNFFFRSMKIPKKDDSNHKAHYIDYNENFSLNKVRIFPDFNYSIFFWESPVFPV